MSSKTLPEPVLLLASVLAADEQLIRAALSRLVVLCGPMDCLTAPLPFDFSSYYEREMGSPLWRRLVVFAGPFHRQRLPAIKNMTNELEKEFADGAGRRRVNIDPGYLAIEHLVLATTKSSYHRPYLGAGIYADLTLIYQHGSYQALAWTYPDYASADYVSFFGDLRRKLLWLRKRKEWRQYSLFGK
ncbi:MAG: DUF4416 family protein [Deltaproteobacteria bacterium]|nr:DUF4416 family protein [Candidatus Anaeroferrophillus wilburensis]MBN2888122.1 DUF4416 family protein [Deltaproteobacteria bacterium]